jgi:hypothetical protein
MGLSRSARPCSKHCELGGTSGYFAGLWGAGVTLVADANAKDGERSGVAVCRETGAWAMRPCKTQCICEQDGDRSVETCEGRLGRVGVWHT